MEKFYNRSLNSSKDCYADGNEEAPSLGPALQALGFASAESAASFDWLYSYPEARPLLCAITTSFSADCVLTEEEVCRYADFGGRRTPPLPFEDGIFAARVLFDAPIVPPQCPAVIEADALRMRLACVKAQISVLTGVYSQEIGSDGGVDNIDNWEKESNANQHILNDRINGGVIRCIADSIDDGDASLHAVGTLREHVNAFHQISQMGLPWVSALPFSCSRSPLGDDSLLSYIEAEHNEVSTVASIVDKATCAIISDDLNLPHELLSYEKNLETTVDSYARLEARLHIMKAELFRAEARTASLSTQDDGRFVEMNDTSSIQNLTAELRTRAYTVLSDASQTVTQYARKRLYDRIYVGAFAQSHCYLETKIQTLRECITHLIEQRLRIICVYTALHREMELYRKFFDSLELLQSADDTSSLNVSSTPSLLPAKIWSSHVKNELFEQLNNSHRVPLSTTTEAPHIQEDKASSMPGRSPNEPQQYEVNWHVDDIDDSEQKTFNELFDGASHTLLHFRQRVGCDRHWLDLHTNPKITALVSRLEDELTSNTVVLETLLRNRDRIQKGYFTTSNRDWVKQVNTIKFNTSKSQ